MHILALYSTGTVSLLLTHAADVTQLGLPEEAPRSSRELFPLLASTQMQLGAGLHRQFIDLSRKCVGQAQRCLAQE